MKKKISLVLLCGVILLGVCGCGSKEESNGNKNDVIGTYNISFTNDDIEWKGTLKLFDSNECYIETHRKRDWHTTDNETADCSYNVLNNEITFKYRVLGENYETDTCTIAKNGLECEHLLYLYAYNKDIWKKE